jgi:DnaK suppressor protein
MQEATVNQQRARELVARERARIQASLAALTDEVRGDRNLNRQQAGESHEAGSALEAESVDLTLAAGLREQLAAVERAEERIALGTYGRSIESGGPIPDARLEAEPLAERTVEEQRLLERG